MKEDEVKRDLVRLIGFANSLGLNISGVVSQLGGDTFSIFDSNNMLNETNELPEELRNICLLIKSNGDINRFILEKAKLDKPDKEIDALKDYPNIPKITH